MHGANYDGQFIGYLLLFWVLFGGLLALALSGETTGD